MKFTKMHGCGNDFVLINNYTGRLNIENKKEFAQKICNRRLGVGADGLIIMGKSELETCDIKMEFYNADGTRGEMCGNGARCLARFAHEELNLPQAVLETLAGDVETSFVRDNIYSVKINLPSVERYNVKVLDGKISGDYIELGEPGVPHFVYKINFEEMHPEEQYRLAKTIRHDPFFPKGTNVNLYYIKENVLKIKTFERGVEDFTLACGTGVSSVDISYLKTQDDGEITLKNLVEGGELLVKIKKQGKEVRDITLIGKTELVFKGDFKQEI